MMNPTLLKNGNAQDLARKLRVQLFISVFITCCFSFPLSASAATPDSSSTKIDSLVSLIPSLPADSILLKTYHQLLWMHYMWKPRDGFKYAEEALIAAKKQGATELHVILLRDVGLIYAKLREFEQAKIYQEKGLSMAKDLEQDWWVLIITRDLARSFSNSETYNKANQYHEKALALAWELKEYSQVASVLMDQAWILAQQGDYIGATEVNGQAMRVLLKHGGEKATIAVCLSSIASAYASLDQDSLALSYLDSVLFMIKDAKEYVNYCYYQIDKGEIHFRNGNLHMADSLFQEALAKNHQKDHYVNSLAFINLARVAVSLGDTTKAKDYYLNALEEAKVDAFAELQLEALIGLGELHISSGQIADAKQAFSQADSLFNISKHDNLRMKFLLGLERIDSASGQWLDAYLHFKEGIRIRTQLEDDENTKRLVQVTVQHEFDAKEAKAAAVREKREFRQRIIRNAIAIALLGTLIFLVIVYRQRNRIAEAHKRSDELLLNILPAETAEELKAKGHSDAQLIDQVTVLFTDFKGFTAMSEQVTPRALVADLHECFSSFDRICEKYGIEKIKTIGDAYMAAGGLPSPNTTHAQDVVQAALEMAEVVEKGKAKKIKEGLPFFEIRIGVNTGPVVAGIVGVKKFQYDIWGDTVNIASHMESSGETGKVNISETTYDILKANPQFTFENRGKIQAKGKGEISMHFVSKA